MLGASVPVVVAASIVAAYILNVIYVRLRHASRARQLNCQEPVLRSIGDPAGFYAIYKGIQASREKRFPTFLAGEVERLCEKHGRQVDTFGVVAPFFQYNIFTIEPQNVQTVLALKFKDFDLGINRTDNFEPLLGNGIFAANGKQWEHSRALLRPQFVRGQVSDLELEEAHVQSLMTVLERHLGANRWTNTVDILPLFFNLTLDSATQFLFGESTNSQLSDNAEGEAQKFAVAFDRSQFTLAIASRFGRQYWIAHDSAFKKNVKTAHDFIDYFVRKALAQGQDEKQSQAEGYVFLNALAEQTKDPTELRSQMLNILLAGRDTTASSLGWFFYTMAESKNHHLYRRLRTIILEDFGTYKNPKEITFEKLKTCQYLQWCINEILRLYPAVPFNGRTATRDTTLPTGGGEDGKSPVYIRKGQNVGYSVHIMHRRKDLWGPDAEEFRPERWQDRRPGWDYLPFNGGPRICIGQQFALTEIGYVIVRMMQRIESIDGSDIGPIKHGLTLTNCPGEGVKVKLQFAEE